MQAADRGMNAAKRVAEPVVEFPVVLDAGRRSRRSAQRGAGLCGLRISLHTPLGKDGQFG